MATSWCCAVCKLRNNIADTFCVCCEISRFAYDENIYQRRYSKYTGIDEHASGIIQDISNFEMLVIGHKPSLYNLELALSDIICYNNDTKILVTLKKVIKKLLICDLRHKALDLTNPKVMQRLFNYEGVLQFIILMGYRLDEHHPVKLIGTNQSSKVLILQMVSKLDEVRKQFDCMKLADLMDTDALNRLVLIHKLYTDSFTLFDMFKNKFFVKVEKQAQLRIAKVLRDWVKHYWLEDFHYNHKLQQLYEQWLTSVFFYSAMDCNVNCKWLPSLCDILSDEYFKQKAEYEGSPSTDVILWDISIPYDITQHSTQEIADQITLIHHELYRKIKPREYIYNIMLSASNISFCSDSLLYNIGCHMHNAVLCLDTQCIARIVHRWCRAVPNDIVPLIARFYKARNEPLSQNLLYFAHQYNVFVRYIKTQILKEKTLKLKIKEIRKIIKMGECFQRKRNYYSLSAVFSALQSKSIKEFDSIWKRLISDKKLQKIAEWTALFDLKNRNSRNLRNYLLTTDLDKKAWVPHVGILLMNCMSINHEICKYCHRERCKCASNDRDSASMFTIRKCIRIADRIKQFDGDQMSNYFEIERNERLQKALWFEINCLK